MLTIFWTLTMGADERVPLRWRDEHPVNLPPIDPDQLAAERARQSTLREQASQARRHVRRVLGVSRHKPLHANEERWRPAEAIDTLLLQYFISYPCYALRISFYAMPQRLADQLHSPHAYLQRIVRSVHGYRRGLLRLWSGAGASLAGTLLDRFMQLMADVCWTRWQQPPSSNVRRWRHHLWHAHIYVGIKLAECLASLPLHRAHVCRAVLSTLPIDNSSTTSAVAWWRAASIRGQIHQLYHTLRYPLQTLSTGYWLRAFPAVLLHRQLSGYLTNYCMSLMYPYLDAAEATITLPHRQRHAQQRPFTSTHSGVTTTPATTDNEEENEEEDQEEEYEEYEAAYQGLPSSSTTAPATGIGLGRQYQHRHRASNHNNERNQRRLATDEALLKQRRQLWHSCAWSAVYTASLWLSRVVLAPLEVLSVRYILHSTAVHHHLPSVLSVDNHNIWQSALQLAGATPSWAGLLCECAVGVLVMQVDWLVCRQVHLWQLRRQRQRQQPPARAQSSHRQHRHRRTSIP